MNREHLKAFLWLRWRLRVNQFRKAGAVNAVFFAIFAVCCLIAAVILTIVGFFVGLFAFRNAPAYAFLFTWDGIVVAVLFSWMIGLITDLQRSEALSLDRFLHLPVSLSGAFLINYLSSLFSITLMVFVPGIIGLILGITIAHGPLMLLQLPLLAAGLFALTAITYQFQGWLASLMANPRRRRTIIVLITGAFILIAQAPNLINIVRPWERLGDASVQQKEREQALSKESAATKMPKDEFDRRKKEIDDQYTREQEENSRQIFDRTMRTARVLNIVLPPGWIPLGVEGLAKGAVIPALLGTIGLSLIGSLSLWRAYRTTLRLYTGQYTSKEQKAAVKAPAPPPDPNRVLMVERRLPWVNEAVSAVATAGFRSLTRAPEAKMAFLAPVIMVVVFGGIIASSGGDAPAWVRPLAAFGAPMMIQFIAGLQLLANQFGYDRAGFRAYVLSPLPRRDILIGKNLAVAPLVLGLGLVGFIVVGAVFPMRVDHYPAVLAQILSMYLVLCMFCNLLAILTPIALAPGSLQPANVKATPILMQMLMMMLLPVAMIPILAPYLLEWGLDSADMVKGMPISLPLSLVVLVLVALLYRRVLRLEGTLLTAREQKVLEVVTSRAE
jgi:hypothetical protein